MRMFLVLAGLTLSLAAMPQEIYRWVDKDGIVHYSDQPGAAGAERVILVNPNTYGQEPPDPGAYTGSGGDDEPEESPYASLAIVQPTPDQVFFGADAAVTVAAELDGQLQPGHSAVFYISGNRRPAGDDFSLELRNLARGTHTVSAAVLDQDGNPLVTSPQISFHVRQPSINTPQSPQRPRPPAPAPAPAN